MQVQHDLSATTAGRNQSALLVPRRCHCDEWPRLSGGSNANRDQLRTWSAGEVKDIHCCVNAASGIEGGRGNSVVRTTSESPRKRFSRFDHAELREERFHATHHPRQVDSHVAQWQVAAVSDGVDLLG
ncbi:hypothetical protein GCM10011490_20970 [Pseudoclavibacter endophyticus]|nr:hypothetical protein GCM10011490_20970 [Pseudoclavibacter endophyticus]